MDKCYLSMFKLLSDFYKSHQENESLASFLSDLDPYIFADNSSADPAVYGDWLKFSNNYNMIDKVETDDFILAMKNFFMYYQTEFGYQLEAAIDYFSNNSETVDETLRNFKCDG